MKFLRRLPKNVWLMLPVLFAVTMICVLSFINSLHTHASESGEILGATAGKAVGLAVGSFDGITRGTAAGFQDGKAAGLSRQDTAVKIEDIKKIGKLEVFVATTSMENLNKLGDDYAALYLLKGEVVFTVDLEEAVFDSETSSIMIPKPEATTYINTSEIQKAAEYQKMFFAGSTEDGFTTYINSLQTIDKEYEKSIANDDYLQNSAREAAIRQVKLLAENSRMKGGEINVIFLENTTKDR